MIRYEKQIAATITQGARIMAEMTITYDSHTDTDHKGCAKATQRILKMLGIASTTTEDKDTVTVHVTKQGVDAHKLVNLADSIRHNARFAGRPVSVLFTDAVCQEISKRYDDLTFAEFEMIMAKHHSDGVQAEAQLTRRELSGKDKVVSPRTVARRFAIAKKHASEFDPDENALDVLNTPWETLGQY